MTPGGERVELFGGPQDGQLCPRPVGDHMVIPMRYACCVAHSPRTEFLRYHADPDRPDRYVYVGTSRPGAQPPGR